MVTYGKICARILALLLACAAVCMMFCACAKVPVGSGNVIDPTKTESGDDGGDYRGEDLPVVAGAVDPSTIEFKNKDNYTEYKDKAQSITISDSAKVSGTGYSLSGGVLKITADGTYAISGSFSDGQIVVDAAKTADVRLVLLNVKVCCSYSAPLLVSSADKLIISLPEGTESSFEDKKASAEADGTEITAAIFSHESVTVNGTGTLNVKGAHNDAITSKDTLKIMGGTINVDAADDGIVGKDAVIIADGKIRVNAKDDAIKSSNDVDGGLGFVYIKGGELDVTCDGDAVTAATSILVSGGTHKIKTCGGYGNGSALSASAKGFKASAYIDITGGIFSVDCADDAINTSKHVRMSGGKIELHTGDDAVHADDSVSISGGRMIITQSREGIEAQAVSIVGGYINITATNDGIKVSDGSDGEKSVQSTNNKPASDKNASIIISGGEVHINASGDGIDTDADVIISGGVLTVSGSSSSENGFFDIGGKLYINGGTVIAAGGSGALLTPSEDSEQNSITVALKGSGGDTITVTDANGKEIISWICAKGFEVCTFSSADITIGQKYSFYINGVQKTAVTANGVGTAA